MSVFKMYTYRCDKCNRQWQDYLSTPPTYCPICEGDCTKGEHDKEYSNTALMSYPLQYPWTCRKCGAKGVDVGGQHQPKRL
jgi:rubrerythrin